MSRERLAFVACLLSLIVGLFTGSMVRQGDVDLAASVAERNALDIAALDANLAAMTDRLINLQDAVSIIGVASHYGGVEDGRITKSGEIFDQRRLTAALVAPLPYRGTWRVTRLDTGASVTVRANDRLPSKWGRLIDLSTAAASEIGMLKAGVVPVRITFVGRGE